METNQKTIVVYVVFDVRRQKIIREFTTKKGADNRVKKEVVKGNKVCIIPKTTVNDPYSVKVPKQPKPEKKKSSTQWVAIADVDSEWDEDV